MVDNWDPFDFRPRANPWQAAYMGATHAAIAWTIVLTLVLL